MSKPKNRSGMVYSTNPDFQFEDLSQTEAVFLPWSSQKFKVSLDKSGRAGKVVSLVEGFAGPAEELEKLAKELKNLCGTGGSAKDGQVLIQGDQRQKIAAFLEKKGVKVKLMG
jgi:translation initiation factor 1